MAASIVLLTALVSVPLPGGHGYINLGDAGVLMAAYLLGGPWGGLCAGAASALADILLGWAVYAPATFLIKGAVALLGGTLLHRLKHRGKTFSIYLAALLVPIGYFLYETVLYGMASALPNVFLNTVQCLAGATLAHLLIAVFEKKELQKEGTPLQPEHYGKIVREPKGGPDIVLLGCPEETDTLLKAGDYLSVRGYTARIVALNAGYTVDSLPASVRTELLTAEKPFVCITTCCESGKANARDVANAALEELQK